MNPDSKQVTMDPMQNVMPYEWLKVAAGLKNAGQNERYWAAVRTPKRPVGQVRFERTRQVATFILPLLVLNYIWLDYGLMGLLMGLPAAWLLGFGLDKALARAISIKLRTDMAIDCGRYRAVKWLSERMGMRREDITLAVIYKMAADFEREDAKFKAHSRRQAEQHDAAVAAAIQPRVRATGTGVAVTAAAAAAAFATAKAVEDVADEPVYVPVELGLAFNPANGMPMLPGGVIDIVGNPLGTDDFGN